MSSTFGKEPPHNKELEEQVLGAVLHKGVVPHHECLSKIPSIFYVDANQIIMRHILQLEEGFTAVNLKNSLKAKGQFQIIGEDYMIKALEQAPILRDEELKKKFNTLIDMYRRIELIKFTSEVQQKMYAFKNEAESRQYITSLKKKLDDITQFPNFW